MAERQAEGKEASSRLAELKEQVHRATKLIEELRESNYSLSGEVAELKRQVESMGPEGDDSRLQAELELLRDERQAIRKRVEGILARLEKL